MVAFKKGSTEKVALSWTLKNECIIHPFIYLTTTHKSPGIPGTRLRAELSAIFDSNPSSTAEFHYKNLEKSLKLYGPKSPHLFSKETR